MYLHLKKYNHIIKKGLIVIGLLVPFIISAAVTINPIISKTNVWQIIEGVIDFVFWISIPIAGIMIILAGYFFVTSVGDPEKISAGKKLIFYVAIGLLIVLLAKGLIVAFSKALGTRVLFP
jgi:hypothetical protein